jgi:hypothetical protein
VLGRPMPNDGNVALVGPRMSRERPDATIGAFRGSDSKIPSQPPKQTSDFVIPGEDPPKSRQLPIAAELTQEQRRLYQKYFGEALKRGEPGLANLKGSGLPASQQEDIRTMALNAAKAEAMARLQSDPEHGPQIRESFSKSARNTKKE